MTLGGGQVELNQMGTQEQAQLRHCQKVVHALENLRKDTIGEKSFTKGTLGALRKPEALDFYLAQGCGTLTIEVCPDLTDKEFYHGLKRAYGNMLHALLSLGWPVPVTNRLAIGLAGLTIGGRNDDLPNWTLTPADFLHTKRDQLEAFVVSQEHKCEKRGREPLTLFWWKKACLNQVKVFGLVLGKEHMSERLQCLAMLEKAHEDNERAFPFAYICRLWNELWAVWIEELRESRPHLTRRLNTDNPRKAELKGL